MTAKKKINIVLIILVLGLWGTVAYKTISQYFFSKELMANKTELNDELTLNEINKDTFNLGKVARDPFLNRQNQTDSFVSKKYYSKIPNVKIKSNPIVLKPKVIINWPLISYHGYIRSKDKNEELILVKIDKRLYKLRKDDEIEGVTVKKVYNDSIEVNFNKGKKIIRLN
ncbi:hypothetical protein [Flavobacterium gawalongense]|uniref:Type II secretion system protein GspC N-terminal domain-containing protein n=1 Tax=Flavobacterium gawalongense TaxID=2594432 RepID=A0A553BN01_9FLAO|nr:hypothetical protein [Flavobacterium gawalongense]TRW97027.1 hypothetical protein FNW33_17025 [Flavobacterium gawalongense]TRX01477.1 hypothetical protein FNW12_16990 [Flavobacterium gawalongense]TRX09614.1 hypothetical protein FNW11_08920 [Flavobacterium gawalongense]TRX10902.1 hypothetical protein FNW10_09100 [Flavobacterium gawalongense]TRX28019.1 hypothetical protein FNW38_08390 [Flavobacterium gawalongense]